MRSLRGGALGSPQQIADSGRTESYSRGPSYGELAAVVAAGALHLVVEIAFSGVVAAWYNVSVSLAFAGYVLWRMLRTPGVFRIWGMRRDNFVEAVRAQLWFVIAAVGGIVALSAWLDSLRLPSTFWLTIALYPLWGIAQQFALQNLIAKNLTGVLTRPLGLAVGAATLFAVAHYPSVELMGLTFVSGIFFTLIYRRWPNLWAIGIAHGLLGTLAFYLVLGKDPGAVFIDYLISVQ